MSMGRPDRGLLHGGMPFNRMGAGPPVVVIQGLLMEEKPLSGLDARFTLGVYRPLAQHREVLVVARRPGTPAGTTLSDLARDYAHMIEAEFEPPVDVVGSSSGGSIAFYLAAEHPALVRRLVIFDSACRMGDEGRAWQRRAADLAREGRWNELSRQFIATVWPDNVIGRAASWVFAPLMALSAPDDPSDMVRFIEAEDDLDFCARLGEISAPTLVAVGEHDLLNPPELARATADGIPDCRLRIYEGRRHGLRHKRFAQDLADFLITAD